MTFIEETWVPSHSVKLFAYCGMSEFSVMQSSVHEAWARQQSGKLDQRLAYNLSKGFATFPWPDNLPDSVSGRNFFEKRSLYCAERGICFTDSYNALHDVKESDKDLNNLRTLFVRMDLEVAKSYGWNDLSLEHGFHDVSYLPKSDRRRFTVSEEARQEIIIRLSRLNLARRKDELSKSAAQETTDTRAGARSKAARSHGQGDLLADALSPAYYEKKGKFNE